jgi:dUTP pyrophosphatase
MNVKIKKLHEDAVIPSYAKPGDAGMDLTAVSIEQNDSYGFVEYDTGLAVEIPDGYVGLVFPRSSVSKTALSLANAVGVIDSNYRGPIKLRYFFNSTGTIKVLAAEADLGGFKFINDILKFENTVYDVGDRVGQLVIMPCPNIELEVVSELSDSERGEGGFGSTGS